MDQRMKKRNERRQDTTIKKRETENDLMTQKHLMQMDDYLDQRKANEWLKLLLQQQQQKEKIRL